MLTLCCRSIRASLEDFGKVVEVLWTTAWFRCLNSWVLDVPQSFPRAPPLNAVMYSLILPPSFPPHQPSVPPLAALLLKELMVAEERVKKVIQESLGSAERTRLKNEAVVEQMLIYQQKQAKLGPLHPGLRSKQKL